LARSTTRLPDPQPLSPQHPTPYLKEPKMLTLDKPVCEMDEDEIKEFVEARLHYTPAQMADDLCWNAPKEWILAVGEALTALTETKQAA